MGVIDYYGVGPGHIYSRFNNSSRNQTVNLFLQKPDHNLFKLFFRHLSVGGHHPRARISQALHLLANLIYVINPVMHKKYLAASIQFSLEGIGDHRFIIFGHIRSHRHTILRRGIDDRNIPQFHQPHIKGARNRGSGKGQNIHIGF